MESIHKHSRARRAVGGRRGSSGNTNKKDKIDTNFFAEYYNPEEPDCDGLAVNVSLRPPANDLTLNKTLELLLSHLRNRTFIISVYDGSYISAELILEAEKGSHFSLYTAPPLPYESRFFPAKVIPPLETNWMPLALTAGCIIGLVVLYVLIRLVKHSIFLRMKKFTNINSNKTTQTRLVKVQEEKKPKGKGDFGTWKKLIIPLGYYNAMLYVLFCFALILYVVLRYVAFRYFMLCCAMPCYVMLCYYMICCVTLCFVMLCCDVMCYDIL